MKKIIKVVAVVVIMLWSFCKVDATFAERSFLMTPMNESVILNPGDSYSGSFKITNTASDGEDLHYVISVEPFYVDESHSAVFADENDRSRIVEWIKIDSPKKGEMKVDEERTIEFTINVPENAPAGGQYACIRVGTDPEADSGEEDAAVIKESLAIGYTLFAEITGESIVSGGVTSLSIPSFVLGGNIVIKSQVENTGNVHSVAKYTTKIYPLFSDKPIYDSSEHVLENSDTHTIFPDRSYKNEVEWTETPAMGVYNVLHQVEYQGKVSEVSGMVIVCPWWVLLIVIIGLIIMVLRIITLVKLRKISRKTKNLKETKNNEDRK